jgi:multiple sugar transport system permease protein
MAQAAPDLGTRTRPSRRTSSPARREARAFYGFASPWILGFILFGGGPVVAALLLSFAHWSLLSTPSWAGLSNYKRMFADPLFYKSVLNTVYFGMGSVVLGVVTCFLLAILLNQKVRGLGFFRTVFYLPSVVAGVATAILWVNILQPDNGLINSVLGFFGIQGPGWLVDERWAIPGLILMSVWGSGNTIVIYLAGLQGISPTLYEAAVLDGAGWWHRFWNVTVPMMSPVIFFNIVTSLIASLQAYTLVLVMTEGGPNNATLMLGLYIYREAFEYFDMGYAAALSWAMFALIGIAIAVQFLLARRWVHYDA